ncbi:MAG: hypothetical protein GY859_11740, partial [Desulfobacterales bacterium]|nr:hypothetical protein [Desulfobacterales bacterium]
MNNHELRLEIYAEGERHAETIYTDGHESATFSPDPAGVKKILSRLGLIDSLFYHPRLHQHLGEFVSLGEDIYKIFLKPFAGLEDLIKSAELQNQPVLLNIRSDCQEINRIPWELLHHVEHGFLGATSRFQIFRTVGRGPGADAGPGPILSPGPLKVLFMACSPDGTTPLLNYEQEEEIILKAVGDLKRRKRLEIDIAEGGSLEELVSLLADQEYHVVHLS